MWSLNLHQGSVPAECCSTRGRAKTCNKAPQQVCLDMLAVFWVAGRRCGTVDTAGELQQICADQGQEAQGCWTCNSRSAARCSSGRLPV